MKRFSARINDRRPASSRTSRRLQIEPLPWTKFWNSSHFWMSLQFWTLFEFVESLRLEARGYPYWRNKITRNCLPSKKYILKFGQLVRNKFRLVRSACAGESIQVNLNLYKRRVWSFSLSVARIERRRTSSVQGPRNRAVAFLAALCGDRRAPFETALRSICVRKWFRWGSDDGRWLAAFELTIIKFYKFQLNNSTKT